MTPDVLPRRAGLLRFPTLTYPVATYGDSVAIRVFKNRERAKAHNAIIDWFNGLEIDAVPGVARPHLESFLFG